MKIAIVCAPGIGDALIFQIAAHHLQMQGYEVLTDTPHRFGKWLPSFQFGTAESADAIFLQHDNSLKAKKIHKMDKPVYTFYGSHQLKKHGPLRPQLDYVCDPNQTMVQNLIQSLNHLFHIKASSDNGFRPPPDLVFQKHKKRIAIHPGSSLLDKNWPLKKFEKVAHSLHAQGFEPTLIDTFPSLEDLTSFLYESAYFIGNDSGPGHIASCLNLPHLIIAKDPIQMRLWRPGWHIGQIVTAPRFKFCQKHWKSFVTAQSVINKLNAI